MGKAVERHLPTDTPFMQWTQDPERLAAEGGDRLENREAVRSELETVKLSGLVIEPVLGTHAVLFDARGLPYPTYLFDLFPLLRTIHAGGSSISPASPQVTSVR